MKKIEEPIILIDYLLTILKKPRKKAKSLLTNGLIYINGEKQTKYNYPLLPGNIIEIKEYNTKAMEQSDLEIIYEDKDLIVVNKPAGLLTIATEKEKEKTLYHKVSSYVKKKNKNARIFIIHRLDKETSGIIMFAKHESIKKIYQENWEKLVLYRGYTALVEGRPNNSEARIINYLEENPKTMKVYSTTKGNGKEAITNYKIIKTNNKYTLLDIDLETGRKNQIRVCMHDLKCPIVGDEKYGSKIKILKRMALHAHRLSIINHKTGNKMDFNSDIPKLFIKLIK